MRALVESGPSQLRDVDVTQDESDLHFRQLLEKLPAGAYTCDANGLITYYNQHAVELWGREPKLNDADDRYCGSFKLFAVDGTPIAHDESWMALALQRDREYNGQEMVVERSDGARVHVLSHANPIHDASGKLIGAVNVLIDISERKRSEEALQQAERSKNEFLAMLAHELRNPLAPVRNAVQILHLNAAPSPELQWALDVIDRQMQHMTRLIDDLLDIARITGNKLELRKDRVELAEVVRTAVETTRPLIEACGQHFVVTVPAEPIFLDGDLTRLAQVISNLLNNAAKYTERGGHIWLNAKRQAGDVVITVRDTGLGIPADMLPRIFDMFTQVERSLNHSQGGLGIGLTLVKRLVEMHGGSSTARSDGPGKGSEFSVRLPIVIQATHQKNGADHGKNATHTPAMRILVVDDNRDAAASLSMLLRMMGNDIRTAHDGLEAVDMAAEFRPNVILFDIGLPRMNGYEAAQKIRQQPWGKSIVLIALTGWGQDSDRDRSQQAGFDHHLVKPVDPAALIHLLASLKQTVVEQKKS